MHTTHTPDLNAPWSHPSYDIRVRGKIYLWGSDALTEDIKFAKPLVLHVRNDVFGEDITFGTQVASGVQTTIGVLKPGQCVSIPVQRISGVFATSALESTVRCVIKD